MKRSRAISKAAHDEAVKAMLAFIGCVACMAWDAAFYLNECAAGIAVCSLGALTALLIGQSYRLESRRLHHLARREAALEWKFQ